MHATISSLSESIQALENEILVLQGSLPPPERKREDPDGNGNEEPDFTDEAMEVDVPSNYA